MTNTKEKTTFTRLALTAVVLSLVVANANAQLPDPGVEVVEEGNGHESALVNFRFIANAVWTTEEAVQKINGAK